jgi:hypothetical protein
VAGTTSRPGRGKLVTFRHDDPITGAVIGGAGVVIGTADDGGIWVRPLAEHDVFVDPENVVPVAADDLDGEPDPAAQD